MPCTTCSRARRAASARRAATSRRFSRRKRLGDNLPRGERCAARADRGARPRHELIAPGRRGLLPRLRRRRLDLPLARARASSATASRRVHVNHRLRGEESEEDARFCREVLGAEVVELDGAGLSEAALREQRYSVAPDRLRATGHTASDQVETILYRLVSRGTADRDRRRGAPTASSARCSTVWRAETVGVLPRARASPFRIDSSNADTKRGLIRDEILPLLRAAPPGRRREHPPCARRPRDAAAGARRAARLAGRLEARRSRRRRARRCASTTASGSSAAPSSSHGEVSWGEWRISSALEGLKVRGWRPGDRLAGRNEEDPGRVRRREDPPIGARGVAARRARRRGVAVPGIVEHPQVMASTRVSATELERAVTDVLIDRDALQRADRASSARRSPPTTPAATCCSSACSRAPSSSWPT